EGLRSWRQRPLVADRYGGVGAVDPTDQGFQFVEHLPASPSSPAASSGGVSPSWWRALATIRARNCSTRRVAAARSANASASFTMSPPADPPEYRLSAATAAPELGLHLR